MRILKYVLIFVAYLNTFHVCPTGQSYYKKIGMFLAVVEIFMIVMMIIVIDLFFKCRLKRVVANYRFRLSARMQQQHIRKEAKDYKKEIKKHYPLFD
jgi:hypothetical protein